MRLARFILLKNEGSVKCIENFRSGCGGIGRIMGVIASEMMKKQNCNLQTVSKFFETNHDPIVKNRACAAKENWKCIDNNQNRVGMFADKRFYIFSQAIKNRARWDGKEYIFFRKIIF